MANFVKNQLGVKITKRFLKIDVLNFLYITYLVEVRIGCISMHPNTKKNNRQIEIIQSKC